MTQALAESSAQANQARAQGLIDKLSSPVLPHFIAGEAQPGIEGRTFQNFSPLDGKTLNQTALGTAADVRRASAAAAAAFESWRSWSGAQRRDLLHTIADRIEAEAEAISLVETADTGQPLHFTAKTATRGAENFRFFADRAPQASDGLSFSTATHTNYTLREPIGPVGVITPWNMPFMLSTWKIAPALAAGCTVVHKPAEWSPLNASFLAQIAAQSGLPAGVLNVVHGTGEEAGRALTEDPAIRAIGFVGGTETGSRIMAQGAASLKRVHFELGGKSPVIVFADADLDRAVDAVCFMIFSLNGQRCNASSRLLVEASIHDKFVERVVERAKKVKLGSPFDPKTEMGPLIHGDQFRKVCGHLEAASKAGAEVRCGGPLTGRSGLHEAGHWFAPTVVCGVKPEMPVAQQEVFGPLLAVMPFADEADAVRIANGTRYGLSAYLWTGNVGRAHRLARTLQAGMVWINTEIVRHLATPFGGLKDSGIGRDGGDWSFDFLMETRNVCIGLDLHAVPKIGK